MRNKCHVLLVGTRRFRDSARSILSRHRDVDFTAAHSVDIELLISKPQPDVAVVNCDDLQGDSPSAVCALLALYPKLRIIAVSSGCVGRVVASVVSGAIHPTRMRNELASAVTSCRDDIVVPLGFKNSQVRPGAHIAYLWKNEEELGALAQFWRVAPNTNTLLLLAVPVSASHGFRHTLKLAGLNTTRLIQKRQLIVLERETADAELLREYRCELTNGLRKSAFVRAVGLIGGSQADCPHAQIRRFENSLTQLLSKLPAVMLCPYHISESTATKTMECALETHPLVIYKGRLHANPFCSV
jgi:hypothetical protein